MDYFPTCPPPPYIGTHRLELSVVVAQAESGDMVGEGLRECHDDSGEDSPLALVHRSVLLLLVDRRLGNVGLPRDVLDGDPLVVESIEEFHRGLKDRVQPDRRAVDSQRGIPVSTDHDAFSPSPGCAPRSVHDVRGELHAARGSSRTAVRPALHQDPPCGPAPLRLCEKPAPKVAPQARRGLQLRNSS